jgi:H+/Na+-translocating ferredoxin:NAD+ oxidoreductase subunit G
MSLDELKTRISYQSLLLAGFALLASALLGLADYSTRDIIKQRLEEDLQASLAEVVPATLYDNNLLKDAVIIDSSNDAIGASETRVYIARKQGKVSAVSFRLLALNGYSGAISLILGVDMSGGVLGVRVISHAETPGLGDKIEVSKSDWIKGFNGHSLGNLAAEKWQVKKDGGVFDQFSGATITPRAIVRAVYQGLQFFQQHRGELLSA